MRVLFIVPYVPNLIRVRPYNLIRHLAARGHEVTVLTLWATERERADVQALKAHCHHVVALPLPHRRSLWNCLRALPTHVPLQAVYCWQPALARCLQHVMRDAGYDVVHVEHLRGACYGLQTMGAGLPTVWDSVDCISYLFQQAAQNSRSLKSRLMTRLELPRTRRYESWLVRQFDRVLITSPVDRDALLKLGAAERERPGSLPITPSPPLPISVLPNGVDVGYFTPTGEPREPATLVITGKMSYHANVSAVVHLVNDIMPHVWAQRPNVKVWIVGKDPPREIRDLAAPRASRLVVTGTVPDLRPYLCRATLAVTPVPYGAGIQNKVLEAMACGTPVVASPQATLALAVRPGRDLVVAESADAFAQAILALLDDPARRAQLGQAGRAYVEAHHTWEAIVAQLEAVYRATIGETVEERKNERSV